MNDFIVAIYGFLLKINVLLGAGAGFYLGGKLGGFIKGGMGLLGSSGGSDFDMTYAIIGGGLGFLTGVLQSGAGIVFQRMVELLEEQNDLLEETKREQNQRVS